MNGIVSAFYDARNIYDRLLQTLVKVSNLFVYKFSRKRLGDYGRRYEIHSRASNLHGIKIAPHRSLFSGGCGEYEWRTRFARTGRRGGGEINQKRRERRMSIFSFDEADYSRVFAGFLEERPTLYKKKKKKSKRNRSRLEKTRRVRQFENRKAVRKSSRSFNNKISAVASV